MVIIPPFFIRWPREVRWTSLSIFILYIEYFGDLCVMCVCFRVISSPVEWLVRTRWSWPSTLTRTPVCPTSHWMFSNASSTTTSVERLSLFHCRTSVGVMLFQFKSKWWLIYTILSLYRYPSQISSWSQYGWFWGFLASPCSCIGSAHGRFSRRAHMSCGSKNENAGGQTFWTPATTSHQSPPGSSPVFNSLPVAQNRLVKAHRCFFNSRLDIEFDNVDPPVNWAWRA